MPSLTSLISSSLRTGSITYSHMSNIDSDHSSRKLLFPFCLLVKLVIYLPLDLLPDYFNSLFASLSINCIIILVVGFFIAYPKTNYSGCTAKTGQKKLIN